MSFKLRQSYSTNDEREQQSVDFIVNLLRGTSTLPQIKKGEKGANIDGYIELLDEERCIKGKLTVQVKTVAPEIEGQYKFPCPTSLFAYAERTLDVVLLMAVDHSKKIVLWKYISQSLIEQNRHKDSQKAITLHFGDKERLTSSNVQETIDCWNDLFVQERTLYKTAQQNLVENETLRIKLLNAESSSLDLPTLDIIKIQKFCDAYNTLLDREFLPVKEWCYPNSWKQGFAFHEYQDERLFFSQYSIKYGENSLIFKQVPYRSLGESGCHTARVMNLDNDIKKDYRTLVRQTIADNVKSFASQKEIPPIYDYYIIEYIRDFIYSYQSALKIDYSLLENYQQLINYIKQNFPSRGEVFFPVLWGKYPIQIGKIYELAKYLVSRGYKGDISLYPNKGHYANTGMVSDWFSSETAFEKTKIVLDYVYKTYTDYIQKNFALISPHLDMFNNADMVLIDLIYTESKHQLYIYHYHEKDTVSHWHRTKIVYSLNHSHAIYQQLPHTDLRSMYQHVIIMEDKVYECRAMRSCDLQKILFSNTSMIDTYRAVIKDQLENFVKKELIIH